VNTAFQQAIANLQRQIAEEKDPAPSQEGNIPAKFRIREVQVSENLVEISRGK
jgi:hypothetical protein